MGTREAGEWAAERERRALSERSRFPHTSENSLTCFWQYRRDRDPSTSEVLALNAQALTPLGTTMLQDVKATRFCSCKQQ
jgi:hypothetical protein